MSNGGVTGWGEGGWLMFCFFFFFAVTFGYTAAADCLSPDVLWILKQYVILHGIGRGWNTLLS